MASASPEREPRQKAPVGAPHDRAEREADRLADALTATPATGPIRCAACAGGDAPCPACSAGAGHLRRSAKPQAATPAGPTPAADAVLTRPGGSLPAGLRQRFERRLGADLSSVRLHTGPDATRAADSLDAHAFALGPNIVVGERHYQPHTPSGERLLAHEVAHVLQDEATPVLRRNGDGPMSSETEGVCEAPPPEAGVSRISDPAVVEHAAGFDPCAVDVANLTNYELLAEYANALRVVTAGRSAPGYFDHRNLQRRLVAERDRRVEQGQAWLAEMPAGLPDPVYQIVDGPAGTFTVVSHPGTVVAGRSESTPSPYMTWAQFQRFLDTHNVERVDAETYVMRTTAAAAGGGDLSSDIFGGGEGGITPFPFPVLWAAPLPTLAEPGGPVPWPALPEVFSQPESWLNQPRGIQLDLMAHPPPMNPEALARMRASIANYRSAPGVPGRIDLPASTAPVEGGTVAVAVTDIPNLGPARFPGASAMALPPALRGAPGTTGGSVLVPVNPTAVNHAEHVALENLRLSIESALAEGRITRADLQGRTVHVLVEQEPCASCGAGSATGAGSPGVLQQFARLYPELTLEVRNMRTNRALIYRSGVLLNPSTGATPELPMEIAAPSRASAETYLTPEYLATLRHGGGTVGELGAMGASGLRGGGLTTLIAVGTQAGVMVFDSREHPEWALELGVGGSIGFGSGFLGAGTQQLITSRLTSSMLSDVVATGGSRITPGLATGAGRLGGGAVGAMFVEGISMGLLEQREHSGAEVGVRLTRAGALGAGSVWAGAAVGTAVGGPIGFLVGLAVGGLLYYVGDRVVPGGREDWDAYEAGCQPRVAPRTRDPDDWPRGYYCFEASTPVTLADGRSLPIGEVGVGTRVLSWNEIDGTLEARSVTAVHPAPPTPMLRIDCANGLRLQVTPPHRLMTTRGWQRAGLLRPGNLLRCLGDDGLQPLAIEAIEVVPAQGPVYDLTVEATHTYFANGVLAHNKFI